MDQSQLVSLLEQITGDLRISSPKELKALQTAQQKIAYSLLQSDDTGSERLFVSPDFYARDKVEEKVLSGIPDIAKKILATPSDENIRAFVRTIPLASEQIAASVPDWAIGAKAAESIGPFLNSEGRNVWIDIYKTVKLTTVYLGTQPLLLFNQQRMLVLPGRNNRFKIAPGTVWINANLLSASAPKDRFVGLKVSTGQLILSVPPLSQGNKITINPSSIIDLSINLLQDTDGGAGSSSKYGKDARDSKCQLPETLKFTWNSSTKKLTAISFGNGSCEIYGQKFNFSPGANAVSGIIYYPELNIVCFPWKADKSEFEILKNKSPFLTMSEKAPVIKTSWALGAAVLNIQQPLQVEGSGGIVFECGKGLRASWQGLENEDARLIKPFIFCSPGNIGIIEFSGDISAASQHFNLWKEKKDLFSSSIDLTYYKNASLIINVSSEKSIEIISAQCNAVFNLDRPVKADGEPFSIRTEASVLMLSASETSKNIYLIDDSILTDYTTKENYEKKHKPVAIALENALFTVSPVSACLLFGECSDNWTKISRANLFLIYGLYRYLPTLPDPYVGKLKQWERLSGASVSFLRNISSNNKLLICAVRYGGVNNEEDTISTGFYFGTLPPDFTKLPEVEEKPVVKETPPEGKITKAADRRKLFERVKTISTERVILGKVSALSEKMQEIPLKSIRSFGKFATALKINTANIEKGILEKRPVWDRVYFPGESTTGKNQSPVIVTAPGGKEILSLKEPLRNDYEEVWDNAILGGRLNAEHFALLDISSNANQMGVSIGNNMIIVETAKVVSGEENQASVENNQWPFFVEGMQVKAKGDMVRAFTLPQIAWEPMNNLTPPDRSDPPASQKLPMDPEKGFLYYENDGGPTRICNNNQELVALAPIPVVDSLIEDFKSNPKNYTISAFTLPFGLKAINYVSKHFVENKKPEITNLRPKFRKKPDGTDQLEGGIQLSFEAGDYGKAAPAGEKDSPMFPGYIMQLNNLLDAAGNKSGASNLGHRVTEIFNNEFLFGVLNQSKELEKSRGVPLSRMDITGYGANIFSNWISPTAAMAQTSQAKFDVLFGRTAHEVIQVKSILYPWGIRVVRTITVFRSATGYIYRTDSGWKAESDGKFDFSYRYLKRDKDPNDPNLKPTDFQNIPDTNNPPPYEFHPGIISGLFNVRNIKDAPEVIEFTSVDTIYKGTYYVDGIKGQEILVAKTFPEDTKCGGVYFDADVEIENVVQGHTNKRVVSKKILGYVQVAPAGKPLSAKQLKQLLDLQKGSIGGDIDCVININNSNQQMRLNRFDVNNSEDGSDKPVFVVAARGAVVLPKAGSWSVVQHEAGTGTVTPLPSGTSVPLIRTGKWIKNAVVDPNVIKKELLRIAHPLEILRAASDKTINFGFLQTTSTQKALFLTPAYGKGITKLLSKTPPVFADAYRLMEGNSIFPNIGNAIDSFGKAMPMLNGLDKKGKKVQAFVNNALKDGGTKVFELLEVEVEKAGEAVIDQGMKLLQKGLDGALDKALKFDIPPFEVDLVKTEPLRIYVEYITQKKPKIAGQPFTEVVDGKLNFDIDSFSEELGDKWKSRLNNLAMVVDLGDMKRLMTIKGNFDAGKTKETGFGGDDSGGNGFPVPEIEFSDALQPVIDILEVLSQLSTGDYGAMMKKGLKIAMSNSGEIWEYKFEANKEIPIVRFPPTKELYDSAQTPLKLEASLGLGVYFNAALKVTTDPKDLLPTAGAFLKFHGGLQVMCFSVGAGSIFAVGNVDVKIACDTKVGPSLALDFAFGVQIVVSLPVVGNASVTYLMGINMYADKDKVVIAALMVFKGHAELVGGLICVTIMIEAKGIVVRSGGETQASAQVTFALDISVAFIIDISFSKTWGEDRQIA